VGTFEWVYAMSPANPSELFVQTFQQWGMGPSPTEAKAVLLYMTYSGSGELNGKTYGAVLGIVDGQVQMSPHWAAPKP
jgi:hypothetical protein